MLETPRTLPAGQHDISLLDTTARFLSHASFNRKTKYPNRAKKTWTFTLGEEQSELSLQGATELTWRRYCLSVCPITLICSWIFPKSPQSCGEIKLYCVFFDVAGSGRECRRGDRVTVRAGTRVERYCGRLCTR